MSQETPRPEFMPTFEEHFDPKAPTLLGCWAKLRRAELHLRDLHTEVGRYIEGNHAETVRSFDPATKVFEARVQVTRRPNYVAWSVLLGDFLHNLRSALDHLVWQLVLVSGERTPDRRNQFPIALQEEHYLGVDGREGMRERMLTGVAQEHRVVIDRVQPYRLGEEAATHSLAHLQRLNNTDKHRIMALALFTTQPPDSEDFVFDGLPGEEEVEIEVYDGALTSPTVLAAVRVRGVDSEPKMNLKGEFRIEFGFGDDEGNGLTLPSFHELWTRVGSLVFSFRDAFGAAGEIVRFDLDPEPDV